MDMFITANGNKEKKMVLEKYSSMKDKISKACFTKDSNMGMGLSTSKIEIIIKESMNKENLVEMVVHYYYLGFYKWSNGAIYEG
jgi:hypothetical protein